PGDPPPTPQERRDWWDDQYAENALDTPAIPKHTKPLDKGEIETMRWMGYHGSDRYTVRDAVQWATERREGWTYLCNMVLEHSQEQCASVFPPESTPSDLIHGVLDAVGMWQGPVGSVADGVNSIIYAVEGDGRNAAISAISAIPFGDVAKAGKLGKEEAQAPHCSFPADTPVTMADGSTRPIGD
ncbi:hypothetical protein ACFQ1S_44680, partial [Kibdelosporangium lantanae]